MFRSIGFPIRPVTQVLLTERERGRRSWVDSFLSPALVRWIWAICLLVGTTTHLLTVWRHGLFWDYGGVPLFTRVYWTSLTFADPLAAALLFARPRLGIALTLAIIGTDVLHNTWFVWYSNQPFWSLANWALFSQIAFLVFSTLTAPLLWRAARARQQ